MWDGPCEAAAKSEKKNITYKMEDTHSLCLLCFACDNHQLISPKGTDAVGAVASAAALLIYTTHENRSRDMWSVAALMQYAQWVRFELSRASFVRFERRSPNQKAQDPVISLL